MQSQMVNWEKISVIYIRDKRLMLFKIHRAFKN